MRNAWRFAAYRTLLEAMARLLLLVGLVTSGSANAADGDHNGRVPLMNLSLEQLGEIEVTTASKEPEQGWRTPAAVYVLTQEDIRRSGATSIPAPAPYGRV
jgi:iron complex outermembrane receptor protein